jgi:superfamily II RNA helicase
MEYIIKPDLTKPITISDNPYSFKLDPCQLYGINAIINNSNVLACLPTGSGKTLIGEYQIYHTLKKGKRVFYTTPIKSLSNQKFYDLKHQFSNATVGIMTGDIKFCPDAQIVIMTTEILRNLLYKKGTTTENLGLTASLSLEEVDAIVFDECHYINDKDRGKIWEETMILLPPHINMVMLSATLDHPEYLARWLGALKQKHIYLIETYHRIVPLTHNLVTSDYKLIQLMDAKDNYHEKIYNDWLNGQQKEYYANLAHQQKVKDVKSNGQKGSVEGKVHSSSFAYRINETVKMLEKEELLPAIFFILSRKQCESYAKKIENTLITSADTAAVKHIISFHLHRYMESLEKVPQYHQLYELLIRGIAFHHSGLLPLLKEIVEILFSKGFVKLLFCTETFAVGLNMPTKTVLFSGFKKYDDQTNNMRMLRNDEYIQMAGRAGRRGKDDKGVAIYLPDREPVTPHEMHAMMKGARPPISSRMDFHYDFILKTMQSSKGEPLKWLHIMEQSYWFQQQQKEIQTYKKDIHKLQNEIQTLHLEEPFHSECAKRYDLERQIKQTANAARKEVQRQLDTVKNKQNGPKWIKAWTDFNKLLLLQKQHEDLKNTLNTLENHESTIEPALEFLKEMGYIKHTDKHTLTSNDLTLKGILATEVNEGHQLLMTELYTQETLHELPGNELIAILSCFQEKSESDPFLADLQIPQHMKTILKGMNELAHTYKELEDKIGYPLEGYWDISTQMVEPMMRWMEGEHASVLCAEYNLFEGNLIRSITKCANMLDEWMAMATYCQHTDQIEKIVEVRQRVLRDITAQDSLYLRL